MQNARIRAAGLIGLLFIGMGQRSMAQDSATVPTCSGWSDCNPGRSLCTFERRPPFVGPLVIHDLADGLSSDGRGPYIQGTDGVQFSIVVLANAGLGLRYDKDSMKNPRTFKMNLNNPVPGGGGIPLGIVNVGSDNNLYTSWKRDGNFSPSLLSIPVGQTVTAGQMNVSFHIDGRFHLLQMGPQPHGHCHGATRVHGSGTSSGTIYRASERKWVMELPAGSVARLFDLSNTTLNAVDKGLYYFRLHYEIDAVPGAVAVLGPVAEAQGGAAVVARYRALKRDSAQAYFFDAGQLSPSAFWLLSNKKFHDAVMVFGLIVEEYPDAWNPYGGLGESYLAVGDTSKAIASYRRSLELNPKNQNAADVLKRLGVKP